MFEQTRIPLEVEEDELTNITQNYISQFVVNRLPEVKEFLAEVDSIQFNLVEPFEVNYTATAVFAPDAEVLPALELDMVVTAAFQGDNMVAYLTIVRTLPTTNIFSTTTEAYFVMDPSDVDPQKLRNRMPRDSKTHTRVTAGAVAGAGAFVLLIVAAGATWGRQRQQHPSKKQRRGAKSNKGGDGKNENTVYYVGASNEPEDETGQMTVAGDTYMADSTVVSASSGSFLRRQTRFAEETYLIDDTQSLASRSEWGLLPINEAKSGDDCGDEELPTSSSDTKTLLYNSDVQQTSEDLLATNSPILPLRSSGENNNDCTNHFNDDSDEDDLSVDDDVPLRVIDLIKKFTPSRF